MPNRIKLSIWIDGDQLTALEEIAASVDASVSRIIRSILAQYLSHLSHVTSDTEGSNGA